MLHRAERLLSRPWAPVLVVGLALALMAPALMVDFTTDDHIHRVLSRTETGIRGFASRPLDLFVFTRGSREENRALMDEGVFPWWTSPDAKLAFMRPLSSLSHALDHALWPDSSFAAQAHGLIWFAASLLVLWALYRRLFQAPWVACLALLLYAVDDARGPTVGWIANRNATIAFALAVPALLFHVRGRREQNLTFLVLSPCFLAAGLFAGESALAISAYLFAYAVWLDQARGRFVSLAPQLAVIVVWRVVYVLSGYGVANSGVYVDPGADPVAFARLAAERLPIMLGAQLFGLWSDLAGMYAFLGPHALGIAIALIVLALLGFCAVLRPLLREDPLSRFFATGMLLSAIPICSTFPADRLLSFVGLGGMGLIARFLERSLFARTTRVALVTASLLVFVHLVLSPPVLALRARSMESVERLVRRTDQGIPRDDSVREKTVVLVTTPGDPFVGYQQITRASRGQPKPAALRWLATGLTSVRITRLDARSLRVEPEGGYMQFEVDRMLHDPDDAFHVGQRIVLEGLRIEVLSITDDGRPLAVHAVFDRPLEDPALLFLRWDGDAIVPYLPPAVGASETLPAIDMMKLLALGARPE